MKRKPAAKVSRNVKSAVMAAQSVCESRGARLTPARQQMYELLLSASRPLSAYELLAELETRLSKRLAPLTVYRALDFLTAQGLVHRLESNQSYVACAHPEAPRHDALYLVCENCGTSKEVHSDAVDAFLAGMSRAHRFKASRPVLEIQGTCADCASRN